MNSQKINRICGIAPMAMSLVAFLLVLVAVSAGWGKGQTDEGSAAHIFQILISGQAPVILLFLITADWNRYRQVLCFLAFQAFAVVVAMSPVFYFKL
jgi:hypothetical protein